MTADPPALPADLADLGWRWRGGFLTSADGKLIIVRPDPIAVARAYEAARAKRDASRPPVQMELEL